jgi:hypothetical protein
LEDNPLTIIKVLYQSLRRLRKDTKSIDIAQKKLKDIAEKMQRTSYLAEMEFHYIYALQCPKYLTGENSHFYYHIFEYMDKFFEKADVVTDLRPYLALLNLYTDAPAIIKKILERITQMENVEKENKEQQERNLAEAK